LANGNFRVFCQLTPWQLQEEDTRLGLSLLREVNSFHSLEDLKA
jgi:hypothetical protein